MSSADDILFSPINGTGTDPRDILKNVQEALRDHSVSIEFSVDPAVSLGFFMQIADLVENDSRVFKAARQLVMVDSGVRPIGAMTIRNVFERLYLGKNDFYWTAPQSTFGVEKHEFTNVFNIVSGIPTVTISNSLRGFEWWVLGLLKGFTGYQRHYCFAEKYQANNWHMAFP